MQKLFLGIYGAIFVSTLLVLASAYYALASINQYRYQLHLKSVMEGTSILLYRGISRQEAENQDRWISLAASLMDANLKVTEATRPGQKIYSVSRLRRTTAIETEKHLVIYQPGNSPQQIRLEIEGITEHILSATAFLMLNELGRIPADERQAIFDQMSKHFNFDILRVPQADLDLDSRQTQRLQNGDTVVAIKRQLGQGSAFNVYAPWGKTEDALVLGPIAFFNPFPTYIAATVLGVALLIMAVVIMLIIRKLSKRLLTLQQKVDAISPETLGPETMATGHEEQNVEVISALSTKIQNMSLRIEKLLHEKAYMIRAVSHDLRTPIAKLHFRLEALTEKVGDDNKLLRGCHDDLRQLNLLIDELLTYEKLAVKQTIAFKPVDLRQIILGQIEGVRVIYPALNINVLPGNTQPVQIDGNEVLLHRLFENLLHNAGRHARMNIRVSIEAEPDSVSVVIDDDGEGLQEAVIPHLFEPFFRADASRNAAKGGYGLGLAIVKQVVMQHNGNVSATNNRQGGASFRLAFPFRQTRHD